ncbi:MAG: carboxypeptidase regulatory-like domain-containing protein [Bacteroidetes bacterium]|nr:carboxypeptidase regulatory-like domain-containing protein [Bacteroidota bacterium]
MKTILFFLFFALFLGPQDKDNSLIKGTVINKLNDKPLIGVQVQAYDKDTVLSYITDRNGNFKFDLKPGTYSLKFTYFVNTDTTIDDVKAESGSQTQLKMELIPNTTNISRDDNEESGYGDGAVRSIKGVRGKPSGIESSMDSPLIPEPTKSTKDGKVDIARAKSVAGEGISAESSVEYDVRKVKLGDTRDVEPTVPPSESTGKAGVLTSGEVNDFRKWDLWKDISENDFKNYSQEWIFKPDERYTVQLVTLDNMPVIDAKVQLLSANGDVLWTGRSDNTGKAELWGNLFTNDPVENQGLSIVIDYKGNKTAVSNIKKFHDGINVVKVEDYCSIPENVDIVFAVDATGSMGDEIKYLKEELKDIISKLGDKFKNIKINLGSIFYRDLQDEYITRKSDLNSDVSKTTEFINQQEANGGGDFPEAVELALQSAINEISWSETARTRLMFLILDAPPHSTPEVKTRLKELTARASMLGIRIIPVTCSGIDKSTEYLMRSLALATNGTYVFLTDESGVGDKHIKPSTDKYDVELLNDLFIRLIGQFTAVPDCNPEKALAGLDPNENILNQGDAKIDSTTENYEQLVGRIKCYPNPTNGELNVELTGQVDEMFIVDITGKILQRFENVGLGKQIVNLKDYPTGIYFIKYSIENRWATQKIMLMR